jgi:hypothetical protein
MELFITVLKMMKLEVNISYSSDFRPINETENDFRYRISQKKKSGFVLKPYFRVFSLEKGFTGVLSIVDLLFNVGPEAVKYL